MLPYLQPALKRGGMVSDDRLAPWRKLDCDDVETQRPLGEIAPPRFGDAQVYELAALALIDVMLRRCRYADAAFYFHYDDGSAIGSLRQQVYFADAGADIAAQNAVAAPSEVSAGDAFTASAEGMMLAVPVSQSGSAFASQA